MIDVATVAANVERVRNRIADAGGDPASVTIVGVTKGHPAATVEVAVAAGLADIGENYAQELTAKAADVEAAVRWHFIGQLQRNKVKNLAHLVSLWQSVDRLRVGEAIADRAPGARVLVQVNLTDDPARGGTKPGLVAGLADGLRDLGLDVRGLMAVAPGTGPVADADGFRVVATLADRLGLAERSIGMSDDLELAVRCGSTMVRVGTALFGPRPRLAPSVVEN